MPSTIKLTDGDTITANEDPKTLVEICENALTNGTFLAFTADDKFPVWVSPAAVVKITEGPEFNLSDYRITRA